MRVYARIFENMFVYAFMRYMLIQNKYKLCLYTFLLTLLLILILNFYFEKYAFMLVFPSLQIMLNAELLLHHKYYRSVKNVDTVEARVLECFVYNQNQNPLLLVREQVNCKRQPPILSLPFKKIIALHNGLSNYKNTN